MARMTDDEELGEVYLGVKETVRRFDKANGQDAVQIGGWWYFRNGAMREVNAWGQLRDPPANSFRKFKIQEAYWETKLKKATDSFNDAKRDWLLEAKARADAGAQAPDIREAEDGLAKLLREVRLCERKLRLIRDQMTRTPEGQRQIQHEADRAESLQANQEFVQAIQQFRS